jgi:hypothetical protein
LNIARVASVIITLQERRSADGLDAHIPIILSDGAVYDADLDRFFLDLPLNGVRSPHSLRAYGDEAPCRLPLEWVKERVTFMDFYAVRRWCQDHDQGESAPDQLEPNP